MGTLRFGEMKVESSVEQHLFEVLVFFYDLDSKAARVELYADLVGTSLLVRQEMLRGPLVGSPGGYLHRAAVSAVRPQTDYTSRVIPHFAGTAVPLEAVRILWYR
jgi:glycogen phosphorylase